MSSRLYHCSNSQIKIISTFTKPFAFALYVMFVSGCCALTSIVFIEAWQSFYLSLTFKVFTLMVILCCLIHTSQCLSQKLMDFAKSLQLRINLSFILNLMALTYVAIGFFVLWSV